MAEAEIKTTSGAIISVKGTSLEVDEILKFWQRREEMTKHRRVYYRNYEDRIRLAHYNEEPFFNKKKILEGPKARVVSLIEDNFFNKFRTLAEIREKLQEKYEQPTPNSSLHPTLMLLIAQGKIIRKKQENDLWGYKIKEKDGKD